MLQLALIIVLVALATMSELHWKEELEKTEALEVQLQGLEAEIEQAKGGIERKGAFLENGLPKLRRQAALLDKSKVVEVVLEAARVDDDSVFLPREALVNYQLAQASDDDLREIGRRLTEVEPPYEVYSLLEVLPQMLPGRLEIIAPQVRPWLESQISSPYQHIVMPLLRPYGSSVAKARAIERQKRLAESRIRATYVAPLVSLLFPLPVDARSLVMECDFQLRSASPLLGGGYR